MGIQIIKMPDIGEGIAEVELVAWRVKVGDRVMEDQILADVMTDKATVEIPSPVNGTVRTLDGVVGQVIAVGSEIIHIQTDGAQSPTDVAAASVLAAAVVAEKLAPIQVTPAEIPVTIRQEAATALSGTTATKVLAAPAVRRRAREIGIDLALLAARAPGAQLTHADLDHYLQQAAGSTLPMHRPAASDSGAEQQIAVIGLRRKIAQKMQESKRHIPHFTYVEEIDVSELEALRTELNAEHGATRGRLTLLPFLVRAMVLAVRQHPEVNARYDDDAAMVTRFRAVHLGLATQTSGGLMVPVMRNAEALDLWACAAEVLRLAEAARSGKASREELSGSTITLTSLGALGGIVSTPVINHPEVAIVGTNRMVDRPVVLGGAMVVRKMMNLSSSFDHRVVDGMNAAQFIQRIRRLLEHPALLFLP